MANQEHLDLLKQGSSAWNAWRVQQKEVVRPDLSGADLSNADLSRANLSDADLSDADLSRANLMRADLSDADLMRANLYSAYLYRATLISADLSNADLSEANLSNATLTEANLYKATLISATLISATLILADLSGADLSGADLSWSNLSEAHCSQTNLTGCKIYAISAWKVDLSQTIQTSLIITRDDEATITVDNLEVAQFFYLLLHNEKIRDVIDTITSKVILILGRFTPERKAVLDALREALRQHNYLPILFDFEKPAGRDLTETISTLAHLARFVIADITDAKSIPQELMAIVPTLPSVPVQPLILNSQHEYGMFEHFIRFPWVLPVYRYTDEVNLLHSLQEKVITPAEQKAKELASLISPQLEKQ